jgi:hypothetical protein
MSSVPCYKYGQGQSNTDAIISALGQILLLKTEAATRASGLLVKLQYGNTYMAFTVAGDIPGQLETLNSCLPLKMSDDNEWRENCKRWSGQISQIELTSDHQIEASGVCS